MFERWREARAEDEELNLIPVMNLMVTLIPFLLLGASFYQLATVPTSIPDNVPAVTDPPPVTEIKVSINMVLELDKMTISGSGRGLGEEDIATLGLELPSKNGVPDLKAMQDHLWSIKGKYPKSDTVVFLPVDQIKYMGLIDILDMVREKKLATKNPDGSDQRAPLFPVTVFSKQLIAEFDAGVEEPAK